MKIDKTNLLRALKIYFKYVSIKVGTDDWFDYYFNDIQYISNRSSRVMSNEEYKFLNDIYNEVMKLG